MANHRALKIGSTVPVAQMEATDAVDNPVNVSGPDVFLGRKTAGEGGHEELTIAGLPAETTPAAGHLLLAEVSGVLKGIDIADLPGGGGGGGSLGVDFTDGGGTGTIPDGTKAGLELPLSSSDGNMLFNTPSYLEANFLDGFKTFGLETVAGSGNCAFVGFNEDGAQNITLASRRASDGLLNTLTVAPTGSFVEGRFVFTSKGASAFNIEDSGEIKIGDVTSAVLGIQYDADYSATISANDRSVPDVGTVNILKQTPVSYANGDAPNNCIFYSTTNSKLAYKDSGGTVNNLY